MLGGIGDARRRLLTCIESLNNEDLWDMGVTYVTLGREELCRKHTSFDCVVASFKLQRGMVRDGFGGNRAG